MTYSFWKTIPVLTLALSVGGYGQQEIADLAVNRSVAGRSARNAVPCGIVEGNQCLARGCSNSMGGAMELDFLYWRSENQGFNSAWYMTNKVEALAGPAATTNYSTSASVVRPDTTWNPGFRLGMGWNTTWDRWDLFFNWTWYKNHATADVQEATPVADATGRGFYPVNPGMLSVYSLTGPYGNVHSSWKLWHNSIDLEIGRAYYLTGQLSMRNHWGVRAAVLKQKFSSSFSNPHATVVPVGGAFAVQGVSPMNAETLRQGNKFWGIGPRAGVQTKYHVGKGFSVVGKGAVALLFGQEKWKSKDLVLKNGETVAVYGAKTGGMYQTLAPNLQMFLGMEWATCFSCDEIYFGMQAGWESNYWWNQYAVSTMPGNMGAGNPVTMEGLTVNFHLDY